MKKILFVASEGVPFIKTGGLADVVGSLPKCIDKEYFRQMIQDLLRRLPQSSVCCLLPSMWYGMLPNYTHLRRNLWLTRCLRPASVQFQHNHHPLRSDIGRPIPFWSRLSQQGNAPCFHSTITRKRDVHQALISRRKFSQDVLQRRLVSWGWHERRKGSVWMHTKETDILFSQQASLQSNQMVDMVFRYLCSLSAGDYIYRSVHGKGQQRPERKRRHRIHHRNPHPPPLHFYQIDIRYAKPITDKTTAQTELTVQTLLAEHTELRLRPNLRYRRYWLNRLNKRYRWT